MRWMSIPEELTLPHLLELQDVQISHRDLLRRLLSDLSNEDVASALRIGERAYALACRVQDRTLAALALLLRAEALCRQHRWEDALDAIRRAVRWLEVQVSPVARYNEAVAVYAEGMLHCVLSADEKVLETFTYAQQILAESERHWEFEAHAGRVVDCRNLVRWTRSLLNLLKRMPSGEPRLILPIYELTGGALMQSDVIALPPFQVTISAGSIASYLPVGYSTLDLGAVPLQLNTQRRYIGIRLPSDIQAWGQGRKGDLLIVETTGLLTETLSFVRDGPFILRSNGRVEFILAHQGTSRSPKRLLGIPRVLIREGESL